MTACVQLEAYKADFDQERKDRASAAGRYVEEEEQLKKALKDLSAKLGKKALEVCACMCVLYLARHVNLSLKNLHNIFIEYNICIIALLKRKANICKCSIIRPGKIDSQFIVKPSKL